ncbi:phosphotransferase [Sorlinia euscelidii]|uniref:Aminoglycoside phosphotransferase domain-containing protein n=1 Tax=Sorlinia euscelidii TaxID=3081148 RepID=A0ABU7U3T7_9PROT
MTEAERRLLIPHYPFLEDAPEISHHSPRPFSSACIFSGASGRFFVKRHDHRVKNEASLREEHRFAQYLAGRALPVQPFLKNTQGETVTRCGDWVYELTAASPDVDLYRDVPSWEGWFNPAQAHAAGRLLAQFHDVMEDDTAPARADPQLVSNMDMLRRDDFASALDAAVADLTPAGRGLLHHSAYKQARAAFHTFHDALNPSCRTISHAGAMGIGMVPT